MSSSTEGINSLMKSRLQQLTDSQSFEWACRTFDGDVLWQSDTPFSLSTFIRRQFWHPGNVCLVSVNEALGSSLDTVWLHQFLKLLVPLCRLCDLVYLHFQGLSDRFVTGYLLPPLETNHLLWVLTGNATGSVQGRRIGICESRLEARPHVFTPPNDTSFVTAGLKIKGSRYYRWCAIDHMQACTNPSAHTYQKSLLVLSWGPTLWIGFL